MQTPVFFPKSFLIVMLFAASGMLYSCENSQQQIDALTKDKQLTEEAKNVEALLSQEGVVKARLRSPLMIRQNTSTDSSFAEFPQKLHVDFFDSTANVQSWLDANYGKYYESLNKVLLRDSVIAININGDTLLTPELWWDQQKEMFYTDKYAELHTKSRFIHGGKGLEASQDFKDITFKEPTGTVRVSESGFPQ